MAHSYQTNVNDTHSSAEGRNSVVNMNETLWSAVDSDSIDCVVQQQENKRPRKDQRQAITLNDTLSSKSSGSDSYGKSEFLLSGNRILGNRLDLNIEQSFEVECLFSDCSRDSDPDYIPSLTSSDKSSIDESDVEPTDNRAGSSHRNTVQQVTSASAAAQYIKQRADTSTAVSVGLESAASHVVKQRADTSTSVSADQESGIDSNSVDSDLQKDVSNVRVLTTNNLGPVRKRDKKPYCFFVVHLRAIFFVTGLPNIEREEKFNRCCVPTKKGDPSKSCVCETWAIICTIVKSYEMAAVSYW